MNDSSPLHYTSPLQHHREHLLCQIGGKKPKSPGRTSLRGSFQAGNHGYRFCSSAQRKAEKGGRCQAPRFLLHRKRLSHPSTHCTAVFQEENKLGQLAELRCLAPRAPSVWARQAHSQNPCTKSLTFIYCFLSLEQSYLWLKRITVPTRGCSGALENAVSELWICAQLAANTCLASVFLPWFPGGFHNGTCSFTEATHAGQPFLIGN